MIRGLLIAAATAGVIMGAAVGAAPTTGAQQSYPCDSNYTPCVPVASDVDCEGGSGDGPEYVAGPVTVVGEDIYGLDRDNNRIGCE
jgi:hypothetical protein